MLAFRTPAGQALPPSPTCGGLLELWVQHRGVLDPERVVQLEVDELQQSLVELEEGDHDTHVDIRRDDLAELVGDDPRQQLPHDLGLEEDALDRHKRLAQRVGPGDIRLELERQPPRLVHHLEVERIRRARSRICQLAPLTDACRECSP